jgi:hypothetical protein
MPRKREPLAGHLGLYIMVLVLKSYLNHYGFRCQSFYNSTCLSPQNEPLHATLLFLILRLKTHPANQQPRNLMFQEKPFLFQWLTQDTGNIAIRFADESSHSSFALSQFAFNHHVKAGFKNLRPDILSCLRFVETSVRCFRVGDVLQARLHICRFVPQRLSRDGPPSFSLDLGFGPGYLVKLIIDD